MKFEYPHTISNGHGEEITFLRLIRDGEGEWLEIRNEVSPGAGPPMHVHHLQDESLTVVKGKIGAQVDGQPPVFYGVGETVLFKRGEVHRFWNAGDEMLVCEGWAKPAYNLEYFLTEIYKSVKANGGKAPGAFDGAYLLSKYGSEFDMIGIPGFVKKVIFPMTLFFGRLLGRHRKFEGCTRCVSMSPARDYPETYFLSSRFFSTSDLRSLIPSLNSFTPLPRPFMNSGIFFAPKSTSTTMPINRISWNPTPPRKRNICCIVRSVYV
jgi:quercetin dioxygenase-like cupin family protein